MSHACLYIDPSLQDPSLFSSLPPADVDTVYITSERFLIADARALTAAALVQPVQNPTRSFVLVVSQFTVPAQNALLKLFEDPPPAVEFHLVIPDEQLLLPTLRSRFVLLRTVVSSGKQTTAGTEFLQQMVADRLATIAQKTAAKDTQWIMSIREDVGWWLARRAATLPAPVAWEVSAALAVLGHAGASNKMLLEQIALLLPVEQS